VLVHVVVAAVDEACYKYWEGRQLGQAARQQQEQQMEAVCVSRQQQHAKFECICEAAISSYTCYTSDSQLQARLQQEGCQEEKIM
jgi:rRNA-processing protein FCF1